MHHKTALAIANLIVLNRLAKRHGITDKDDILVLASIIIVAAESSNTTFAVAATGMCKAPPEVVVNEKVVLAEVKRKVDIMLADPAFIEKMEATAVALNV